MQSRFPESTFVNYNHASYGLASLEVLEYAAELRKKIELDNYEFMGPSLGERLERELDPVRERLGLEGGSIAACTNVTEANNALASSIPLAAGDRVVMFDCEYESVMDAWDYWAGLAGATVEFLHLDFPATADQIVSAVRGLSRPPRVLVMSAISPSHALSMPLAAISDWCADNGVALVVDAAHVVGHDDGVLDGVKPMAVMASLHKWLPIPRSAGFLWVDDSLTNVTPGMVALRRSEGKLTDRFSWRGTWDPTPNLCVTKGHAEVREWEADGLVAACEDRAAHLTGTFEEAGLVCTGEERLRPPRLRAFLVPGTDSQSVIRLAQERGMRVWAGADSPRGCVVRFATHMWQTEETDSRIIELARVLAGRTSISG